MVALPDIAPYDKVHDPMGRFRFSSFEAESKAGIDT